MVVYTYFDPAVAPNMLGDQNGVIRLWSNSWRKHGWEPRVLGPRIAKNHPLFDRFVAQMAKHPTVNNRAYEDACYRRWLALAVVGGGLMVDYDVINFRFEPHVIGVSVAMYDPTYVPCAVWASRLGANKIITHLMEQPVVTTHTSDMILFKNGFDNQVFGKPTGQCIEYGVAGWDKAPLVHFSAGATRQFPSKQAAIQKALNAAR